MIFAFKFKGDLFSYIPQEKQFQNDKDFLELLYVLGVLCFSFDHHKGSSRPKGDKWLNTR